MSVAFEKTIFPLERYADELATASENRTIGNEVWFENEQVRVWRIDLEPRERLPFHCHETTYFWVCVEPGRAIQRHPSGTMDTFDFRRGDVEFLVVPPGKVLIHDLENTGETTLRFVTVELLAGRP